jgi:predicted HicB family RNase H-like nuclease
MTSVNFTGSVDRELLKRAKVIAAKADTSVNALFNAELRYLVVGSANNGRIPV